MAKKKKKKGKKRPPPRAAMATGQRPASERTEPAAGTAPAAATRPPAPRQPDRKRPPASRRREAVARQQRRRAILIVSLVVLALVGIGVFRAVSNRAAKSSYMKLAASAGCGTIRTFDDLSREHVDARARPTYPTKPPVGGAHQTSTVPASTYDEPFSDDPEQRPNLYQAVHSLEHGYIIVWHNGLEDDDVRALERAVREDNRKVIIVPYPELSGSTKVALTTWGVLQTCREADAEVLREFVELYREKTAPEPNQP
jgi:hypothetical protein